MGNMFMISPGMNEYLANVHREDLLREARQAPLAAEATGATNGWWDRALRLTANVLLTSGHRLNARLCNRRLGRTAAASHYAPHAVSSCHQSNIGLCCAGSHGVVARYAMGPGPSGEQTHA